MEIAIAAAPERVWKALVNETDAWWRKDFYACASTKAFRFEARVGGRVFEEGENGAGVLWYTVIAIDPPRSVDLSSQLAAKFGGPALCMLRLDLVPEGSGTVLKLSDSILGPDTDPNCKRDGWRLLLEEGLKEYVERESARV